MKNKQVAIKMEKASITKTTNPWNTINWAKVQRKVFKLQKRIFQAVRSGDKAKARNLQKLMSKSYYAKLNAVRSVTPNNQGKKTADIGGKKGLTSIQRLKLVQELELRDDNAKALLRVWIPKAKGFPTIKDRAMQALVKSAIEPYWEAQFEGTSYGFRPGRSAHDAIGRIHSAICKKAQYVLDADISKCFDKINHDYLLSKVDCPTSMKHLIKKWLKARVMDNGVFEETNRGIPQGGIISPLLANIALDGMKKFVEESFPYTISNEKGNALRYRPKLIRYADDVVVLHHELKVIQQCKLLISEWLRKAGLEIKPEKTRICHSLETVEIDGQLEKPGFDFLGFEIRQYKAGKYQTGKTPDQQLLGFKTIIRPSKKSIKAHYEKLRDKIDQLNKAPQDVLIRELSPIIQEWCNYYRTVCSQKVFSKMSNILWNKLRAWTKSRTGKANFKNLSNYFSNGEYGKWTFQSQGIALKYHHYTKMIRHTLVKADASPYNGNWTYWSKRQSFTPDDLIEVDHKNLQLRYQHCHHTNTNTDGSDNKDDVLTVPIIKG
jgi:RNA-directed DNA polymerase